MNPEFIGFTLDAVGKIMVAYTAIRVHYRFWREHAIDERVFTAMKSEQFIGVIGIAFILAGFLLQLPYKI